MRARRTVRRPPDIAIVPAEGESKTVAEATRSKYLLPVSLALYMLSMVPAEGFNTRFLDDAAISRFNDKDIQMMLDTLRQALNQASDGSETKWENPKTGHYGTIVPLNTRTHDGMDCRDADIRNFAGSFTGRGIHLMCKTDDGVWRAITQ